MQAGPGVLQQERDRDPHNRPVALETPKDQYNRHLEAARSRSGSLGPRLASPRHASPINGAAIAVFCHSFAVFVLATGTKTPSVFPGKMLDLHASVAYL